jgi:hypothetical protein
MLKKNYLIHFIVLVVTIQIVLAVVIMNTYRAERPTVTTTRFALPTETAGSESLSAVLIELDTNE